MKLQRLHIKGFRNLEDLDLDLSNQKGLSVLIGNNGSGKSNVLEAVVAIFASWYNRSKQFRVTFEYDIEYTLDDHTISIVNSGEQNYIDGQNVKKKQIYNHLPKNIIASYSGDTSRLEDIYFTPFRKSYIKKRLSGHNVFPRMWFINKDMWNISLLSLFLHSFDVFTDIGNFCKDILGIAGIEKIKFSLAPWRLTHNNEAKQLLDAIKYHATNNKIDISFQNFKTAIDTLNYTPKDVFQAFYIGRYANGFTNIELDVKDNNGNIFNASFLSEGEKKLLSVFSMLEVLSDEKSLMLYDEPDSHVHISRKGEINKLVNKYLNRQHIISTHSPTLAATFLDSLEHLNCLAKTPNGYTERVAKEKYTLIAELTDNIWNVSDQNTFIASSKPITLLVEGKTDKIHIEEAFKRLKPYYPELDFDVFYFKGATNIPPFVTGLKTCEIDFSNRVIIAIFDNDKEGRDCCNQTQVKYVKNNKNKHGLYAITLPLKSEGTIENMYDQSKYDIALKSIVYRNIFSGLIIDYADFITKHAKIELSNIVNTFDSNEFENFRPLFDIIKEIKSL